MNEFSGARQDEPAVGAYASLAEVATFARLADPTLYAPLPDAWSVLAADVVASTEAIAAGRYKAVNAVGAAVIAAVSNALPGTTFPFVFAGDGAGLALPPEHADALAAALAATAVWAREEFGFILRAARVTVAQLRAEGHDVRVARFAPSPHVTYAMFAGGGLAHAEARMKAGTDAIPSAPAGARPDLVGLTCRFAPIPARCGVILSLIAVPRPGSDPAALRALAEAVLEMAEGARPLPELAPAPGLPREALRIEASLRPGPRWQALLRTTLRGLGAAALFRLGRKLGGFDPRRYRRELVENSDFCKFDDGLRMTLDVAPEEAAMIEAQLAAGARAGVAAYGLHRQDAALVTCYVPNATRSDQIHLVDGASGGYASAAAALKRMLAATEASACWRWDEVDGMVVDLRWQRWFTGGRSPDGIPAEHGRLPHRAGRGCGGLGEVGVRRVRALLRGTAGRPRARRSALRQADRGRTSPHRQRARGRAVPWCEAMLPD